MTIEENVIYLTPEEWDSFSRRGGWVYAFPGSCMSIFHGTKQARGGSVGEVDGKKILIREENNG